MDLAIRPEPVSDWDGFLESSSAICVTVAPLEQGLILDTPRLAVITETALFGDHARQTRRRKPSRDPASIVRNLTNLEINAPVVHEEHGVGRYLGLETLKVGDIETEYLAIEYAGNDKLYVPVASLALVSRYTGASPEHAPLHKLGSEQWERARRKATRRIHDVAVELLDIYARRAARKGHAYSGPGDEYAAFAADFPFEETPDQEEDDQRRAGGHAVRHAHGPAGVWRCRLWQDRGGHACSVPGGTGWSTGCPAGAHYLAGATALPELL